MGEQLWQDRSGRFGEISMVAAAGRVTWLKDANGEWWTPTECMTLYKPAEALSDQPRPTEEKA